MNLPLSKLRTRKDMVEFLKNHPGRSEWLFVGASVKFARTVKISHLNTLTHAENDACLRALDMPYEFTGIKEVLDEFEKLHPGYAIYEDGRSGGHFTLNAKSGGGWYPSRTEDYSDWEFPEVRDLYKLVWDFDQACQEAVDTFVDFAMDWEVANEA